MTSGKALQKVFVLLLLNAGFLGFQPVVAEESAHNVTEAHQEFHPNLIAVFTGFTGESRRDTGFTVGLEYERRLNKSFGIGALLERTIGDVDLTIVAIPFAYHQGPWKVYTAPGIERNDGHNEKLLRFGVEYGFEVGKFEIAPQIDYDFVDGDNAVVVGVTLGWGF
jgi:hypothetical protein